jgi:hypothetical protein
MYAATPGVLEVTLNNTIPEPLETALEGVMMSYPAVRLEDAVIV